MVRYLLLAALALTLAACSNRLPSADATVVVPAPTVPVRSATTVAPSPTPPPTLPPTATGTPAPTATSLPASTLAVLDTTLVGLCPDTPLVPLEALGLVPSVALLVRPETLESPWDDEDIGLFRVTADTVAPTRMEALRQAGYINNSWPLASPNGRWLLFRRRDTATLKDTIWVASADGQQQWPLEVSDAAVDGHWLNDTTVLLYSADTEWAEYRVTEGADYFVVNPFTGESEQLADLPPTQVEGIGGIVFQQDGRIYLLYQDGYDFRLFEHGTQTDQQVLAWLTADTAYFLDKGVQIDGTGQIVIEIQRSYGFDTSGPLSVNSLIASQTYTETMRQVHLPEAILPARGGSRLGRDHFTWISSEVKEDAFYLLDGVSGVIHEYCIPTRRLIAISPDFGFAAFTRDELPSPQPVPKIVYVLNLETGHLSQITDYEAIGWITLED